MKLVSFDVRVGYAGVRAIPPAQQRFHEEVAKLLFPQDKSIDREGLHHSSAIDHKTYVHNPRAIGKMVRDSLEQGRKEGSGAAELCLIDFTSNPFVDVRDPLLVALADAVVSSCRDGLCPRYIVLLPELPGAESASCRQFRTIEEEAKGSDYLVIFISNSGDASVICSGGYTLPPIQEPYKVAFTSLYGNPDARLARKCVRRLGHFRRHRPGGDGNACSHYSYHLYDCEGELYELFEQWWQRYGQGTQTILLDLANNPYMRNAVRAFGEERSLTVRRIADVLGSPDVCREVVTRGRCTLVVDAVETGSTLTRFVQSLGESGIETSSDVLAVVNRSGGKLSRTGDHMVRSFLARPADPSPEPCMQCKLGLPFTSDAYEPTLRIRAFDMYLMAEDVGWEPEPEEEIPDDVGSQYRMLPAFSTLLQRYGDWIAYKIHVHLKATHCPEDWFVVHPDEADSTSISDRLQPPLDYKLSVVRVPRSSIKEAQEEGNLWQRTAEAMRGEHWVQQLESIAGSDAAGLVLDIFNGSGRTRLSLEALLRYYDIVPFAYVCLADFDPAEVNVAPVEMPRYSLYELYNPRRPA